MAVRAGDQWGRVLCLYVGRITHKEYAKDAHGKDYEAVVYDVPGYSFRCDCGKEWDVEAKAFQGKRVVRDCGCGLAGVGGGSVVKAISTTNAMFERVSKYAAANRMNFSHAANKLMTYALDALEAKAGNAARMEWGADEDEHENDVESNRADHAPDYNPHDEFRGIGGND